MEHQPTLCIDLDGTIATYDHWRGPDHFGTIIPGAREALLRFKEAGWRLIIFTTRGDVANVRAFLEQNNIPYHYINENPDQPPSANRGKPIADIYIDDRAIGFRGDWEKMTVQVADFRLWYKEDGDGTSPY